MNNPNTSEKSNYIDREENITKGNLSAKKVALYTYDSNTDTLEPYTGGSSGGTVGGATEEEQENQVSILNEILSSIKALAATRGIASDIRVTLLGGTTAVTGSLTTVTGLTNIGGLPAVTLIPSNQNTTAVLSNINNVSV